ncbi:MAG: hypothetical protein ACFFF4_10775 [Candidatus Thorarchaeota archaeon]
MERVNPGNEDIQWSKKRFYTYSSILLVLSFLLPVGVVYSYAGFYIISYIYTAGFVYFIVGYYPYLNIFLPALIVAICFRLLIPSILFRFGAGKISRIQVGIIFLLADAQMFCILYYLLFVSFPIIPLPNASLIFLPLYLRQSRQNEVDSYTRNKPRWEIGRKIIKHVRENKRRVGLVIIIIMVILASFTVLWVGESSSLVWKIKVGDTFEYQVSYISLDAGDIYEEGYGHWGILENSTLLVSVTAVPEIPIPLTVDAFLSEIVKFHKVDVILSNGSRLPDFVEEDIIDSISSLFLPTGGWGLLDLLFTDSGLSEYNLGSEGAEYHSKVLTSDVFFFEYLYYWWDSSQGTAHPGGHGGGWRGEIAMATGVSNNILIIDAGPDYFGTISVYGMNLTRIN